MDGGEPPAGPKTQLPTMDQVTTVEKGCGKSLLACGKWVAAMELRNAGPQVPLCQEGPWRRPAGPEPTAGSVAAVMRSDVGPIPGFKSLGFSSKTYLGLTNQVKRWNM